VVGGVEHAHAWRGRGGVAHFDYIVHAYGVKVDEKILQVLLEFAHMNMRMTSLNMPLTNQ
jgi:hypothetical protein